MRFRGAHHLQNLGERFVAPAFFGEGAIHRRSLPSRLREGKPAALVHVVRNGQRIDAAAALAVHPVPQILRIGGVRRAKRQRRHAALEDDIAMQRCSNVGGILVADEGRELVRHVVPFGSGDGAPPSLAHDAVEVARADDGVQTTANGLRQRIASRAFGGNFAHRQCHAQVLGVVRHGEKVERRSQLQLPASRVRHSLAFRIPVGVVRRGAQVSVQECIQGIHRMDMQISEVCEPPWLRGLLVAVATLAGGEKGRCHARQRQRAPPTMAECQPHSAHGLRARPRPCLTVAEHRTPSRHRHHSGGN